MFAVRFGSYSIDSTTAETLSLVALEIDDAVALLVAAADVARGDAAVVVAATAFAARFGQVLDRGLLPRVISSKPLVCVKRRDGVRGRKDLRAMVGCPVRRVRSFRPP